jgi:lipoyl(octanoyl) transferase
MPKIVLSDGLIDYLDAVAYMQSKVEAIKNGAEEEVWFLEHPPLFTLGTSANLNDILEKNLPVYESQRGGKVTYHGPGQLIAYVMLDLKKRDSDLRKYVSNLEEWIIKMLAHFNIKGMRKSGRIGVWLDDAKGERKIAAIGVRISKGITWHGVSLNVSPDLSHYQAIIPCGLKEFGVTSMQAEGINVSMQEVKRLMIKEMEGLFTLP